MSELVNIDISPLFSDDPSGREIVEERIREAVLSHGGFVIHDFPENDKVDALAAQLLSFFDLPGDVKDAITVRSVKPENTHVYRGYIPSLGDDAWAHNEMFDIGPDVPVAGPAIPGMEIPAETNLWPTEEPGPGWRAAMQDYYDHMKKVSMAVMLATGRTFGIAEEELLVRFADGNSTLRLINYPEKPASKAVFDELEDQNVEGEEAVSLAAGRHTDAAGVSLLWQAQPGLQAQSPEGVWRDIPKISNSISVHLGDVLETMTDGKIPATPHRVIDTGGSRQSIGFFLEPALSAHLSAMDEKPALCQSADTAEGTYGWHLLKRLKTYAGNEDLIPDVR